MTAPRHIYLLLAAAMTFVLAGLPVHTEVHADARSPLVVVVNASSTATGEISLALLRRIFRGEAASTSEGKRWVPLNGELRSRERELFDRKVLGLEPDDVAGFWIKRRLRDEGLPPRIVPSELMTRVVASYPNAIGYIAASAVGKGIRVLKIDGRLPGDADYLFTKP